MTAMVSISSMRRVRLLPTLEKTPSIHSKCFLSCTPINNFMLPPPTHTSAIMKDSMENSVKIKERLLKPSLRNIEIACPESIEITAVNKSVHFNEPLAQVVHFYTPPPLDEYDEYDEEETEEEEEDMLEDAFLKLYSLKGLQDDCGSIDNVQPAVANQVAISKPTTISSNHLSLPNWPLPNHPWKRFISQIVSLESIVWDNTLQVVQGRVLVHNLAYEKKVTIRCSFDDWKSWIDVDAHYKKPAFSGDESAGSNSAFDCFLFKINVADNNQFSCSMAIRYQALGQEFWDNNNGNNFTVQSMPPSSKTGNTSSPFEAAMQQPDNNEEGLPIIPRLNFTECNKIHQEKAAEKSNSVHIVSQSTTSRHQFDRFKYSKYGASKIAVPIAAKKRSNTVAKS
ncbi:putative phosphatase regulatory subunit-domain-containing protein [Parasitella parasitica]|nr:putative phosphatase regulatory subunit-domain-containing protein [Parasitella parasitica]